jgi:hypothetical protein
MLFVCVPVPRHKEWNSSTITEFRPGPEVISFADVFARLGRAEPSGGGLKGLKGLISRSQLSDFFAEDRRWQDLLQGKENTFVKSMEDEKESDMTVSHPAGLVIPDNDRGLRNNMLPQRDEVLRIFVSIT